MPSARTHDDHSRRILDVLVSDRRVSQRSLAKELGIALGLTNLLIRRLIRKGWVRVIHIKPNRVRYLVTPTGIAEKAKMSRAYFEASVRFYRQTRDRIHEGFSRLSATWPPSESRPKRIVFYGAGEVAEIGYICLTETDLQLVGVVDAERTKAFFSHKVRSPDCLDGLLLDGQPFERLVVMSFANSDDLRAEVETLRVPADCVFWV